MKLGQLLQQIRELEMELADVYRTIGDRHAAEHDIYHQCHTFSLQCERHARALQPHAERYGPDVKGDLWRSALAGGEPESGLLLLRDLQALFLAAEETSISWVMAGQAAQALRDAQLLETVSTCHTETELQVKWLTTRIKFAAPQTLAVR